MMKNMKVICTNCGFNKTPEKEYSGHSNIKIQINY